jgi:hypothetical protein
MEGKGTSDTTFGSVMLIPPCGRSISALFFALIALSNAGILGFAQNDTRRGYPLRMTNGAYELGVTALPEGNCWSSESRICCHTSSGVLRNRSAICGSNCMPRSRETSA